MGDLIFSQESRQRYIDAEISKTGIAPGHGHVKLKITMPDGKVTFAMAARVNENWLVQGDLFYAIPSNKWGGSVEVIGSW